MKITAFIVYVVFELTYNIAQSASMVPDGGPRNISDLMINQIEPVPLLSKLNGKVNLIYFGFAGCGKTCPVVLSALNKFYKKVDNNQLVIMFFNIDPSVDHQYTQKYVDQFNRKFKAASGTQQQIDKAGERFYALFWPESSTTYQHTDYIAVVNQNGQFEALYHFSQLDELTDDVEKRLLPQNQSKSIKINE